MLNRGPELVGKLSNAVKESCDAFARLSGQPVNELTRAVIARRIMECADSGQQDPEKWKEFALGGFYERQLTWA